MKEKQIEIFQSKDGQAQVEVHFEKETVWLSQAQMVELFDKNKRTVSEHIRNIFKEGELQEESVVRKFRTTADDGKTYKVNHYNLDVVISVGYRVKSQRGTQFRIWATQRLREYLTKGYTLNQQRFEQNAQELEAALSLIKKTAQSPAVTAEVGTGLVEIVSRYTQTFLWLQRYDEGLLNEPQGQIGGALPTETEAKQALGSLKANLIQRGEATDLFAKERSDGLSSILGNLEQTVFGEPAYPSIESKAQQLPLPQGEGRGEGNVDVKHFTSEQLDWLNKVKDQIAQNAEMSVDDFEYTPFNQACLPARQEDGLLKARELFGKDLQPIIDDKTAGQPFCTTHVAHRAKHRDELSELKGYLIA